MRTLEERLYNVFTSIFQNIGAQVGPSHLEKVRTATDQLAREIKDTVDPKKYEHSVKQVLVSELAKKDSEIEEIKSKLEHLQDQLDQISKSWVLTREQSHFDIDQTDS